MFDHTDRWGLPYCLNPGSGRATVVNCIVWNNTAGWSLADSPYTGDRGSHLAIYFSNVQSNGTISANSTLHWGAGNISTGPQFVNQAGFDLRLTAGSPCIDAGTNAGIFSATNLLGPVTNLLTDYLTNDFEKLPRPLDSNGDGVARIDMGAFERFVATADSNGDGIPDGWCVNYGFSPVDPTVAAANPDNDPFTTADEYVADTSPLDALSHFHIEAISNGPPAILSVLASPNRRYSLFGSPNPDGTWLPVAGQTNLPGNGGLLTLTDTNVGTARFYRVGVKLP
jgi:hypothetical protein